MKEDQIKAFIAEGLRAGKTQNEIHRELQQEGVQMTFMEFRMLSSEVDYDWEKRRAAVPEDSETEPVMVEAAPLAGGTQVEVSKITRPGAAINGSVIFSSGLKAEWVLDQYGRLGLEMEDPNLQPSEEEMMEFQQVLQSKLGG